jgi:hypothetical protein
MCLAIFCLGRLQQHSLPPTVEHGGGFKTKLFNLVTVYANRRQEYLNNTVCVFTNYNIFFQSGSSQKPLMILVKFVLDNSHESVWEIS